jgi:hypothetical protein
MSVKFLSRSPVSYNSEINMDEAVGSVDVDRADPRRCLRSSEILAINLVESVNTRSELGTTDVRLGPMAEPGCRWEATPAVELRREPRIPTDDPAFMRQFNPVGGLRPRIRALNVSKSGLKLQLPEFVESRTVVQIFIPETLATAEVRYFQPAGQGTLDESVLDRYVDEFHLSVRSWCRLNNAGVKTIGDLTRMTKRELLAANNFGTKSLNEIKEILSGLGLTLKPDMPKRRGPRSSDGSEGIRGVGFTNGA